MKNQYFKECFEESYNLNFEFLVLRSPSLYILFTLNQRGNLHIQGQDERISCACDPIDINQTREKQFNFYRIYLIRNGQVKDCWLKKKIVEPLNWRRKKFFTKYKPSKKLFFNCVARKVSQYVICYVKQKLTDCANKVDCSRLFKLPVWISSLSAGTAEEFDHFIVKEG